MAAQKAARKRQPYSGWIMSALKVLKPPEDMTVTEWADKYRVLSPKDSASPGLFHTSRTPYLEKPMNCFNDLHIREITFCNRSNPGSLSIRILRVPLELRNIFFAVFFNLCICSCLVFLNAKTLNLFTQLVVFSNKPTMLTHELIQRKSNSTIKHLLLFRGCNSPLCFNHCHFRKDLFFLPALSIVKLRFKILILF